MSSIVLRIDELVLLAVGLIAVGFMVWVLFHFIDEGKP